MATPLKFNETFRQEEVERGAQSLFYFLRAILGFDRLDEWDFELCASLEARHPYQPWLRKLVSKYRAGHKSVVCSQGYPLWRGFYIPNYSTKLIEGSSDNARYNHFLPLVDLLTSSPRSDYIQWLFKERIPDNWAGTNSDRIVLKQTNPLASAMLSYWGINSKFEGWHGNLFVLDDAQGTDSEESEVGADAAWRAYHRAEPLLVDHNVDQGLVLGVGPIHRRGRSFVHELKKQFESAIVEAA